MDQPAVLAYLKARAHERVDEVEFNDLEDEGIFLDLSITVGYEVTDLETMFPSPKNKET